MRNKQHTLLAGVAALALLTAAGTVMAQQNQNQQTPQAQSSAQTSGKNGRMQAQPNKPGASVQQHAQTRGQSGNAAAANTQGVSQQPATAQRNVKQPNRSAQINRSQQGKQRGNRTAQSTSSRQQHMSSMQSRQQHMGATAQSRRNQSTARAERGRAGRMSTAQRTERNGSLKGLQGNANLPMRGANGNISLSPDQRSSIRDTVINARGAPRVGHVDFNVRVGTLVPRRRIHVVPVPETLVRIDPQWRGFLYFIVRDEVVIVNPRDMRIVAVLPA